MGMYDTVIVKCPNCDNEIGFQSKSGDCLLDVYKLNECPNDVLFDVNRHSPYKCDCGSYIEVDIKNKKSIIVSNNG